MLIDYFDDPTTFGTAEMQRLKTLSVGIERRFA